MISPEAGTADQPQVNHYSNLNVTLPLKIGPPGESRGEGFPTKACSSTQRKARGKIQVNSISPKLSQVRTSGRNTRTSRKASRPLTPSELESLEEPIY